MIKYILIIIKNEDQSNFGLVLPETGAYGGIFRTYTVLLFISCARLFLFRRSFFLFYYLVRTTFLFRSSFFLFYYLVRTTFKIVYVVAYLGHI